MLSLISALEELFMFRFFAVVSVASCNDTATFSWTHIKKTYCDGKTMVIVNMYVVGCIHVFGLGSSFTFAFEESCMLRFNDVATVASFRDTSTFSQSGVKTMERLCIH